MTRKYNIRGSVSCSLPGYTEHMERRLLVVLAALAVAVVAVGLSAAATMSRGDSAQPAKDVQRMKPAKKTATGDPAPNAVPVVATSGKPQRADEVESYWTKERMADAEPMEKTRQGGSPSSSPSPTGVSVPGSAPGKASTRTSGTKDTKSSQSAQTGVVSSPGVSNPNYWTDDAMADAQPMDPSRPGGTGSQGDPDPGGTTVPGAPPP